MKLMHAGLLIADCERAAAFYEGVLGLERDMRPELGFPGLFYRVGEGQLHLMQLDNPYQGLSLPEHGGRDRHMALGVDDMAAIEARLKSAAIPFTRSKSGRAAIFCRDPDGNAIELCQL